MHAPQHHKASADVLCTAGEGALQGRVQCKHIVTTAVAGIFLPQTLCNVVLQRRSATATREWYTANTTRKRFPTARGRVVPYRNSWPASSCSVCRHCRTADSVTLSKAVRFYRPLNLSQRQRQAAHVKCTRSSKSRRKSTDSKAGDTAYGNIWICLAGAVASRLYMKVQAVRKVKSG